MMGFFDRLFDVFTSSETSSSSSSFDDGCSINPANGLPMIGGCGGLDIHGNAYGFSDNDPFSAGSSLNDSWSSSSGCGDLDSFGSISGCGSNSFDNW